MATDEQRSPSTEEPSDTVAASSVDGLRVANRVWWWLQAVQVRLRFLIVVLIAAGVVSQWQVLRSVWERSWWQLGGRPEAGSVSAGHEYFCPMDPGVLSTWPAICPICNMDLVPRRKMDAQLLPEGVIARMQLSPYRIQLAGIRTSVVEPRSLHHDLTFSGVLQSEVSTAKPSLAEPPHSPLVGFEVSLGPLDAMGFTEPRPAAVNLLGSSGPTVPATARLVNDDESKLASNFVSRLQILLDDAATLTVGSIVTATVSIPVRGLIAAQAEDQANPISAGVLSVPESAVIDRGRERLVYVETMPGQFDGVAVELGRRCGAFYPVLKGLKSGQRVATAGAFLIDAETRLNPSLAADYFGANRSASIPAASPPPAATTSPHSPASPSKAKPTPSLSPADQTLADKQRICPVTELPLNSMGGPIPVTVAGRKVFICCVGCEARLKQEPQKYLARLPAN
ncbi:MAG: heavy metal-binding domain-containing protein [Planctomycetota bacterium]